MPDVTPKENLQQNVCTVRFLIY